MPSKTSQLNPAMNPYLVLFTSVNWFWFSKFVMDKETIENDEERKKNKVKF